MTPTALLIAWRGVVRRPQFAIVMVFTMALSIGAASTVFGLFDQAFLRAMPFPQPERLLRVHTYDPATPSDEHEVSLPDFDDFKRQVPAFEALSSFVVFPSNLQVANTTTPVRVAFATPELFGILGARPLLGRTFNGGEDVLYGNVRKAVLSHALWQALFNSRRTAIGQTVVLRGERYEVIGVMPPTFTYPERVDLWAPLMARYSSFTDRWWELRSITIHTVLGRLKTGASVAQAQAQLDVVMGELRQRFKTDEQNTRVGVRSIAESELRALRPYVLAAGVAGILVLAIGCLNIASLLVAQAVARDREMALHSALGAGVGQLSSRLIAESLLVGALGALGGVAVAVGSMRLLSVLIPVRLPFWLSLTVDARVVTFTTVSALVLSLILSLAPLRHHRRIRLNDILKLGGGAIGGDRGAMRLRRGLLIGQVAVSVVVVIVAGLIVRSVSRILDAESGMRTSQVLAARGSRYIPNLTVEQESIQYGDEWLRIARRLGQLPGVKAVSLADEIPFESDRVSRPALRMYTRERSTPEQAPPLPLSGAFVMPGYYSTLGIAIIEGRDFTDADRFGAAHVIVISDDLAKTLFPGRSALGQEVKWGEDPEFTWATVVGIVGRSRWIADEQTAGYEFYYSQRQHPTAYPRFLLRTDVDPQALAQAVRRTITEQSPEFGVEWVKPLETLRSDSVWRRILAGWLIGVFGMLGLLLSAVGVYGVTSYMVSRRAREMSVRLALGSSPWTLCRLVVRDTVRIVLPGVALGIVGALVGSRALAPLLWDTSPIELVALGGAAVLTLSVALVASLGPAVRVLRIAPMRVLRED